ncbi:MAG TPA: MIP/aquaporin family protein [Propioniciclava sp.]|jgi:glycerol uptake facilitator protein|uniref:MIP/aquaporin family protein n=1 Tax=Propioniciclava sp. TaxID=2038686 RepID=UPI002D04654F|nr:MIP/aquaporin family protein [Propioniciclava sp.]HRL49048.1 MIP/aquaporin family protein [Propioniciclava sp.]
MSLATIFLSETVGTAMLILLGAGSVANTALPRTKGHGTGTLFVNWGWGLAVFAGVLVSYKSGGHLNPAVTLGVAASGATEFVPGIAVSAASIATYISAQFLGAIIGAAACWLAYKQQFDQDAPGAVKLGVFSTGPEIRSPFWNVLTEVIGTFVLVFVVLAAGHWGDSATHTPGGLGWLGALGVALLIVGIGISLGGPTGYAINPARDLGPRIAHALLPIKGKGGSDWGYAWVPVVGPVIGGVLAGVASGVLLPA